MASDDPIDERPLGAAGSPGGPCSGTLRCEEWESLAAEALDGSLGDAQAAAFEQHWRQCPSCAQIWKESRRGSEWLRFLDDRPQPPAGLAEAILSATSGIPLPVSAPGIAERPFWRNSSPTLRGSSVPGLAAPGLAAPGAGTSRLGTPGLFMTAAMAFFSLALTVSLLSGPAPRASAAGSRSPEIPPAKMVLSSLNPSSIRLMATRQYYVLQERGAKFYDNLPLVRELEAETRSLSSSNQAQSEGGIAPPRQGQSRNGGSAPLPQASPAGEVAASWIFLGHSAFLGRSERGRRGESRLLEHPSLDHPGTRRSTGAGQPGPGQPRWSWA